MSWLELLSGKIPKNPDPNSFAATARDHFTKNFYRNCKIG